jgi:hypothetical protein
LQPYRYMMWFDSDTFPMQVWKQDPIATMVRNNLVLLFDNFPMGGDGGAETHRRIRDSFGRTICDITLGNHGEFITTPTDENGVCVTKNLNRYPQVKKIHGFLPCDGLTFLSQ